MFVVETLSNTLSNILNSMIAISAVSDKADLRLEVLTSAVCAAPLQARSALFIVSFHANNFMDRLCECGMQAQM